ncbi:MAG: DegQ family serine endoprotease [Acidobacteriota bacterium]
MDAPTSALRRSMPVLVLSIATLLLGFLAGWGAHSAQRLLPAEAAARQRQPIFSPPAPAASAAALDEGLNGSLTKVARAVMPAVVNISSTRIVRTRGPQSPFHTNPFFRRFFGEDFFRHFDVPLERREQSLGSGVIVSSDGYVLTNNHVVESADEIRVALADRQEFVAKVVGTDPKTDLAVLKLDSEDLPYLSLGDSDATEVGEVVLAIGNPFGIGQTVTMGIISAKGRAHMGIADYEDFIQTDAAINPGNSGGALVNTRGELIGINTAIASRTGGYQGIGFAIPSNMARSVSEELIHSGKVTRGWLGVIIQEVTPPLAEAFKLNKARGSLVGDVAPGSPAARGGLQRGDVIIEYEGREVTDTQQLRLWVAATPVGHEAKIVVLRDGKRIPLEVTIGELEDEEQAAAPSAGPSRALEGVQVEELTASMARRLGIPRTVRGVVVSRVQPGSTAAEGGLETGDVIREVNRTSIASVSEYRSAVRAAGNRPVVLLVQRGGTTFYMTVR